MISINTISHGTSSETAQLEQQLQQARMREQYYRHQKQILLHKQAQLDRKKRNRRIFTRGGMLEAFMRKPLLLSDDQVYQLLKAAFNTREVQDAEATLISETEQMAAKTVGGVGDAGALGSTPSR